jgi:hypothetical protein
VQGAADGFHSVLEADQPRAASRVGTPYPVVADRQPQAPVVGVHLDRITEARACLATLAKASAMT